MKKVAVWSALGILVVALTLGAASCGGKSSTSEKQTAPQQPAEQQTVKEQPSTQETVPAQTTVTETPAATTAVGTAPNIPSQHSTAGCPVCHEQGVAGAPKWPADHAGRTEQVCGTCHQATK